MPGPAPRPASRHVTPGRATAARLYRTRHLGIDRRGPG
jgi:hypothetical protein